MFYFILHTVYSASRHTDSVQVTVNRQMDFYCETPSTVSLQRFIKGNRKEKYSKKQNKTRNINRVPCRIVQLPKVLIRLDYKRHVQYTDCSRHFFFFKLLLLQTDLLSESVFKVRMHYMSADV